MLLRQITKTYDVDITERCLKSEKIPKNVCKIKWIQDFKLIYLECWNCQMCLLSTQSKEKLCMYDATTRTMMTVTKCATNTPH